MPSESFLSVASSGDYAHDDVATLFAGIFAKTGRMIFISDTDVNLRLTYLKKPEILFAIRHEHLGNRSVAANPSQPRRLTIKGQCQWLPYDSAKSQDGADQSEPSHAR